MKPVPQPGAARGRSAAAAIRERAVVLGRNAARPDRDAEPQRLDQPQGRAVRRPRAAQASAQTIAKNSPPVRLLSPAGAKDSYFAQFGWTGEGVAVPGADTRLDSRAPGPRPRQAGDAELDQPDRPAVRADRLGRRRLSVHRQAAGRERRRRRRCGSHLRPRQPRRTKRRTRRPGRTMSARSASSTARPTTTSTGRRSTKTGQRRHVRQPRRLARLHRQILADGAGPAGTRPIEASFRKAPSRRLPGRLSPATPIVVAPGQAMQLETRAFRRRQGKGAARPL